MKLLNCLVSAALAGVAVALSRDTTEVYLFQSHITSTQETPPRIPKEIARHVLLRRVSKDRYGSALGDIPNAIDQETAISHINKYGKSRAPLFGSTTDETEPSQLVLMLEGITADNVKPLKEALAKAQRQPAFFVSDPTSSTANSRLVQEFQAAGASSREGCTLVSAVNPNDASCWQGSSLAVMFDVRKTPDALETLIANIPRLANFVSKGEVEVAVILLPESSRTSGAASWAANPSSPSSSRNDLRRRDSEAVLASDSAPKNNPTSAAHPWAQDAARAHIPQCFQSQNSCEARTNNCSGGHGVCVNRYAEDAKTEAVCFACRCSVQVVSQDGEGGGQKTVRWAGNMCQKKDVSSPFWLIVGFTVTIVGVLTFSIGLLFNVGEEPLPGVIGAGVSRGVK